MVATPITNNEEIFLIYQRQFGINNLKTVTKDIDILFGFKYSQSYTYQ